MEKRTRILALISSTNALPFKTTYRNKFVCFYCPQTYSDFPELVHHNTEHRITEKQTDFALKNSYQYGTKLLFQDFACKLCNLVAESYDELIRHLTSAHEKKFTENDGILPFQMNSEGFKCAQCPLKFNSFKLLTQHINSHLCNFVCEQCGVGFATIKRAKTHALRHLNGSFKCELCDKTFSKSATLRNHVETSHLKVHKHKCDHCAETFLHYNVKINHLVTAHGVKVPQYRCTMCPKVFLVKGRMKCHVKNVHLKITKYECEFCNKKFAVKDKYEDHLVTHTGERNFQCEVCKKKYSRKKVLVAHMRIHNNDKRYVCQFCSRAFVHKCSLQSHINTQHKVKVESDSE
ncbi:hypothetical protein ABMA28_013070 [Loxostege sticticalis]|uniref:C2H2-type domain-containing protein n=1 Tax=Loxostege sticticalis TaxID=481309 RepID=A0ABD0S4I6_LOXSC